MTSSEDFTQRNEKRRKTRGVRWISRIALGLLMLLTTLAVTGLVYQAVATRNDRQEFPPPGQLVAVDGYQLHINCIGEGNPTVILDAAGGNASPSWGLVQPEIAQSTRVCAYDRAGMGWSERGPRPRDMNQHVAELRLAGGRRDRRAVCAGRSLIWRSNRPGLCQGVSRRGSRHGAHRSRNTGRRSALSTGETSRTRLRNARLLWLAGSRHLA
jgi:hypothetical protein